MDLYQAITWIYNHSLLTHWGRVTHICVIKLTVTGSDNGLSPERRQAIIWTNAGILLIRTLGTNFSEILCEIHSFSFSKIHLKMSSAKWRLFGLGLNELTWHWGPNLIQDRKRFNVFVNVVCKIKISHVAQASIYQYILNSVAINVIIIKQAIEDVYKHIIKLPKWIIYCSFKD